jgi:hypothetical protein
MRFFLRRSESGDFGKGEKREVDVIFFLTSLFNDSRFQSVATEDRRESMKMERENRSMATKKKAKKAAKKKH